MPWLSPAGAGYVNAAALADCEWEATNGFGTNQYTASDSFSAEAVISYYEVGATSMVEGEGSVSGAAGDTGAWYFKPNAKAKGAASMTAYVDGLVVEATAYAEILDATGAILMFDKDEDAATCTPPDPNLDEGVDPESPPKKDLEAFKMNAQADCVDLEGLGIAQQQMHARAPGGLLTCMQSDYLRSLY